MNKKEIKDYLKRVDELETKLTGEDKETFVWLIYGYNQCAKLLNETEQQCKKQKEVIDKAVNDIQEIIDAVNKNTIIAMKQFNFKLEIIQDELSGSNDILKEVE